jgi:transcriptional regulator with XRE-family HTH domain
LPGIASFSKLATDVVDFPFPIWQLAGMAHPLTKYREQKNLSQPELARLLGVGRSTVHRWEAATRKIDRDLLPTISEKTGIPAKELRPDLVEALEKLLGGPQ